MNKREIIVDNYNNPFNRGLVDDNSYLMENSNNESCIDNLDIMMKVENGIIKDIVFDGEACVISTSSISLLIKVLLNKEVDDARKILNNYENMINNLDYDKEILSNLVVFDEVYKQESRKKCALLPKVALDRLIERLDEEVLK